MINSFVNFIIDICVFHKLLKEYFVEKCGRSFSRGYNFNKDIFIISLLLFTSLPLFFRCKPIFADILLLHYRKHSKTENNLYEEKETVIFSPCIGCDYETLFSLKFLFVGNETFFTGGKVARTVCMRM